MNLSGFIVRGNMALLSWQNQSSMAELFAARAMHNDPSLGTSPVYAATKQAITHC